jgi:coenzyme F420 hydrogenase subunit beta
MSVAPSPTVARVLRGQLCTGCGLCASASAGAIVMETVPPGYSRPAQLGAIDAAAESVIAAACPGSIVAPWTEPPRSHPYWGPSQLVMTGHATDETLRFRASSGGALSALAIHALRSRLVDRVVHVIADPVLPTRNVITVSTTADQIAAGSGSRYAASSPLEGIHALLEDGARFAFLAKPCDVSALRQLARVDPRVDCCATLMLSFFCAGIPSHDAAGRILAELDVSPDDLMAFRYRGAGWPGKAVATLRDGRIAEMSYARSWGGHLSKEVQFRCKICPDAVGGVADIACADAWYGDDEGYPSFEEQPGRSLILARTERGETLLNDAIANRILAVEPLEIAEIDRMQPSQARRKRLVRARIAALAATLQPSPNVRGTMVHQAARTAGIAEQLRGFLGTVRRIVVGRR